MIEKTLFALLCVFLLPGCASFTTTQTETRYDKGQADTTITTKVSAWTFFEGKSSLGQFSATQSEKTQSAKVGSLSQEASSTNATALVEKIIGAAVKAAVTP